jgi:spore coat protein U-like protein
MKRTGGTEPVSYQLYSDAGRATVLTTVAGTGTGYPQPIRVYGRVPPQAAPPWISTFMSTAGPPMCGPPIIR